MQVVIYLDSPMCRESPTESLSLPRIGVRPGSTSMWSSRILTVVSRDWRTEMVVMRTSDKVHQMWATRLMFFKVNVHWYGSDVLP